MGRRTLCSVSCLPPCGPTPKVEKEPFYLHPCGEEPPLQISGLFMPLEGITYWGVPWTLNVKSPQRARRWVCEQAGIESWPARTLYRLVRSPQWLCKCNHWDCKPTRASSPLKESFRPLLLNWPESSGYPAGVRQSLVVFYYRIHKGRDATWAATLI